MDIKELESFRLADAVKFHSELNPKLWIGDDLDPVVYDKLMAMAEDFMSELGIGKLKVEDITISGSNAAYSYTPHSDIDLHILVDMDKLSNDEVYRELFNAKKNEYNNSHDLKIRGIPVELYVQDSEQPHHSLGEYSLLKKDWIRVPVRRKANFDQDRTRAKYEKLGELIELALKTKSLKDVERVLDIIKRYRKSGLDQTGEFGPENLAFKAIRKHGLFKALWDLKQELHSKELSLANEMGEDYDPNGPPPGPEFKPTMPKGTVRVDVSDVYDWYKLGQHISNLKGLGKHDFGKGPPSTILSFGDEDLEHKYIDALKKTGLDTTDIDPPSHKKIKGQKVDPTYNVGEARSNPEQNIKAESGMKELEAIANTISDPENWAISMTSEPKLGINPQVGISEDTPKGIYFYPLNYVLGMIKGRRPLPWGNDYPYIQLFQYDRSGEMTEQTKVDPAKLKQALLQYCPEEVIQQAIDDPEYDGTPYWFIYDCLSRLGKSDETNVVRWNKVLRDLGFTSVFDPGEGWIAYNEPTQGVVLDPRIIKQHKTIANRKESKVITPARIAQLLFDEIDMELARNRIWQLYDPDGSKLRQAVKKYAEDPKFKPYMGKPGSQELEDKIKGYRLYGARQLSDVAMAWYKAQQQVNEAFDQPYRLKWEAGDYGDVDAYAKLDDGTYLSIMFNKGYNQDKEEAWNVEFFRNNSQEVTGEGDQQRVFATVLSAIQKFIKKYKPNKVIFSASKEVDDGQKSQSRARLYDSLVQRYARAWGFRAFRADAGNKVIYELSKIKKDVAEGTEQINEYRDRLLQYVKGLLPTWPDYVLKDWLVPNKGDFSNLPADALKNSVMEKVQGAGLTTNTKWQLIPDMKFTMDMFDPKTKQLLAGRAGGKSDLGMGIPKDAERHATQAQLAKQQGGVRKEPVLLIKSANGYELLEGWHRTIQHFHMYPDGYTGPAYVAVAQGLTEGSGNNIPTIGINVRSDGDIDYASLIVDGKKKYESRKTDSLRPYVGKTVGIVRTGNGPAVAIGQVTIGEPIVVDAEKFNRLRKQHLVPQGSKFDIDSDGTKYLYPMINPVRWDNEKPIKNKGIVSRKMQEQGVVEASGYIPSKKEKNDPRFKTALTIDVKPDSIKKNAKAFSWLTSRAGIPPQAKTNGKV